MALKTLLISRNGKILENMQEVYSSLQSVRVVMAAKDAESPGCRMDVWKSSQDPRCDTPFKVVHGPCTQRAKAGYTKEQLRNLRENGVQPV